MIHKINRTLPHQCKKKYRMAYKRKILIIEADDWGSIRMPQMKLIFV